MTDIPIPPIPIELASPILARCVHLVAATSLCQPEAISQPLNVLARTQVPLVTKAALMQLPKVDMDWATKCGNLGLLDFMLQWSSQRKGRPLNYSPAKVVSLAVETGDEAVVEWWLDKSGLVVDWRPDASFKAFCGQKRMQWLGWWKAQGIPYLKDRFTIFPGLIDVVCAAGLVDVLDWLLNHVGAEAFLAINQADRDPWESTPLTSAIKGGHVAVLDWLLTNSQVGVIGSLDFQDGLPTAMKQPQTDVLEWYWKHAPSLGLLALHHAALNVQPDDPECFVTFLNWCESAELKLDKGIYRQAAQDACTRGDLALLQRLHSKGKLIPKHFELFHWAFTAGRFDVMDWIRKAIVSTHTSSNDHQDLWSAACESGQVGMLDWLLGNGFTFPHNDPGLRSVSLRRRKVYRTFPANAGPMLLPTNLRAILHPVIASMHIHVLKWLLDRNLLSTATEQDALEGLVTASEKGYIDVLDWLVQHLIVHTLDTTVLELDGEILACALKEATKNCHREVLDWWSQVLSDERGTFSYLPSVPWRYDLLENVFRSGRQDVLEWWLPEAHPPTELSDVGLGRPYLEACNPSKNWAQEHDERAAQVATLDAWHQAGQPIDYETCIHTASVHGRIDVLDWLLKVAHVPEDAFAEAWSSPSFTADEDRKCDFWFSNPHNHGQSLIWWRANLPHVCAMSVNRGPYINPIHAHFLEYMIHNESFRVLDALEASQNGLLSVLMYLKQQPLGHLQLQDKWESALVAVCTSYRGGRPVLNWWKQGSGVAIKCPQEIQEGTMAIKMWAKQWWSQSGFVDANVLAKIQVD